MITMKQDKEKRLANIAFFLLMILSILGMIGIRKTSIMFFNNDDIYLNELISGTMTGIPESHLIHITYPLGRIISGLYRLYPYFPWYGAFLFGCMVFSISICFSVFASKFEKVWQKQWCGFLH